MHACCWSATNRCGWALFKVPTSSTEPAQLRYAISIMMHGQLTFIHNAMIMFIIHSLLPCWRWSITIATRITCLTLSWITSKFVDIIIIVYLISCCWSINFYSIEAFLPEMYRGDHRGHISAAEIDKKCSDLSDEQKDHKDYIADVVSMCSKLHGCYGVFYDITVSLIPGLSVYKGHCMCLLMSFLIWSCS